MARSWDVRISGLQRCTYERLHTVMMTHTPTILPTSQYADRAGNMGMVDRPREEPVVDRPIRQLVQQLNSNTSEHQSGGLGEDIHCWYWMRDAKEESSMPSLCAMLENASSLVKPRSVSAQEEHKRRGDDPVGQTSSTHADPDERLRK